MRRGGLIVLALSGMSATSFLEVIVLFNLALFVAMTLVYHLIDFEKHFTLPVNAGYASTGVITYYVLMCQSNVMCEIVPKSKLGRSLLSLHIALSWLFVLLMLAHVK